MIGQRKNRRPDWRKAGMTAIAVGVNAGAVALLSWTDFGLRERPYRTQPVIVYLDPWPIGTRAPRRPTGPTWVRPARSESTSRAALAAAPPHPAEQPTPTAPEATLQDEWRVRSDVADARPPARVLSCSAPQLLSAEAQNLCQERRLRLASGAAQVVGTGDPERDAAFARQGARRLAAWENQRAAPTDADEPCIEAGPITECGGVNVKVDLFSSRDGFLPNLRKRRE